MAPIVNRAAAGNVAGAGVRVIKPSERQGFSRPDNFRTRVLW